MLSCRFYMRAVSTKEVPVNHSDCALALQELVRMGVENIITFDAHDPRVQNAIPLSGFETVSPTYQFIKMGFCAMSKTYRSTQII